MTSSNRRLSPFGCALFALALVLPALAHSGIRVTALEGGNNESVVAIEGDMARIDNSTQDGFILIDMKQEKIYAVSDRDKEVVDLTSPAPEPSAHAEQAIEKIGMPEVVMQPLGAGPIVSGYATDHYRVMVNDTVCYDEYLATGPLSNTTLMRFVRTMALASRAEKNDFLSIAMDEKNRCRAADNLVDDQYPTLGIPMRTVAMDQQVTHQINSIDEDASFDAGFFRWPSDYPVYTRRQLQDQSYSRMKSMGADDPTIVHRTQAIEDMITQHGKPEVKDLSGTGSAIPSTPPAVQPAPTNAESGVAGQGE